MVEHFHSAFMCDFRENRVTDKLFAAKWAVSQRYRKNIVPIIFIIARCTLYSKIMVASILGHIDTAKHHSFSKPIDVYSSPAKNLRVFTIITHHNSPLQKRKRACDFSQALSVKYHSFITASNSSTVISTRGAASSTFNRPSRTSPAKISISTLCLAIFS